MVQASVLAYARDTEAMLLVHGIPYSVIFGGKYVSPMDLFRKTFS